MDDQSLNMNEGNKVKFRSQDDDISYIHSSEANQLDIVSATIELSAPEDNVTVNVDGALKAKTELGLNNVDDSDDFVIKREEENPDYVFINKNESGDLIFKTNTGGGDDEKEVMRVLGNTGDVLIEDADAEESNKLQFYDDDQYIYVTIDDDGDFFKIERVTTGTYTIINKFNLGTFPFDKQRLVIPFQSKLGGENETQTKSAIEMWKTR